jgi:UPF0755 protein
MKKIIFLLFLLFVAYFFLLGSPNSSKNEVVVVVPKNIKNFEIVDTLIEKKLVKNETVARFLFGFVQTAVQPGGYLLRQNMDFVQVLRKMIGRPDMAWVSINACLRKEQIGEILQKNLGWTKQQLDEWDGLYPNPTSEYFEGVYYPDTYLIPMSETPQQVAKRFINRFNEQFAPYEKKYRDANVRWVTGLKIASLIAREAAGSSDMRLISGIIWNRLNEGMPLQLDTTMQYTAGKGVDGSWWGAINLEEKQNDSPYNSYLHKGLPPTPICSPSIAYIDAVLNSEETDCFFYLHDRKGNIHCSKTYEEHLDNIKIYLQ